MKQYRIAACSGIDSGKPCQILSWKNPQTKDLRQDYPFVGGRTPESMKWIAVKFADGRLSAFPKNRVVND